MDKTTNLKTNRIMLTPKKKAKELYDKYLDEAIEADAYFLESNAKRCAKIAVEEILKEYSVLQIETSFCYKYWKFWQEVLSEIENL